MGEPNQNFSGLAKLVDPLEIGLQPGTGDGFIRCIMAAKDGPATTWTVEGDSTARPMDEEVRWPAGTFNISFNAADGVPPPATLAGVPVRPGLGTIIVVDYSEDGGGAAAAV